MRRFTRLLTLLLALLTATMPLFCACAETTEEPKETDPVDPAAPVPDEDTDPAPDAPAETEPVETEHQETEPAETEPVSALPEKLSFSDPEEYAKNLDRAIEYAKTIHDLFWNSETCLSKLTPEGGSPCLWPYTEQSSMVNGILLAMDADHPEREYFETYLRELLEGLRFYRLKDVRMGSGESWNDPDHVIAKYGETDGTPHSYAIYAAGRFDKKKDVNIVSPSGVYFDDNVWVAKTFYYGWVNTGDMTYLNEATNIMNWILGEGYETAGALNGVYWKWSSKFRFPASTSDSEHASLNTCSTASSCMVLAKLVTAVEGTPLEGLREGYYNAALAIYDFCTDVLVDKSTKCLYDNLSLKKGFETQTDLKKQIEKTDTRLFAYNTGTYMTAGAELYALLYNEDQARAEKILKSALVSAKGADAYFADTKAKKGQYNYPSQSWFNSFLTSGFADLAAYDASIAEYEDHMRSALDYAWTKNRSDDGLVCPNWVRGWSMFANKNGVNEDNPRQILLQSANAHCYAMLARFYK